MAKTNTKIPAKTTKVWAKPAKQTSAGEVFFDKQTRPGTLIVVEWPDGSGKSTQVQIIQKLLEANGFFCHFTAWNSNLKIKPLTRAIKKQDLHCPAVVFDMMFAADFEERYLTEIKGKLRAGMVVLCDRYFYTALARGYARGLIPEDLKQFYLQFFPVPDMTFYFRLPVDVAAQRIIGRDQIKHYEAGMDMRFSHNLHESFHMFQSRVIDGYDAQAKTDGIHVIDGTKPVYETTPEVIKIVSDYFQKKYDVTLVSSLGTK